LKERSHEESDLGTWNAELRTNLPDALNAAIGQHPRPAVGHNSDACGVPLWLYWSARPDFRKSS
jgi:hypothetical protein